MKREWKITIETTPEGIIRVAADNWNPPGFLSEKEREGLSKVLEPFVTLKDKLDIMSIIGKETVIVSAEKARKLLEAFFWEQDYGDYGLEIQECIDSIIKLNPEFGKEVEKKCTEN